MPRRRSVLALAALAAPLASGLLPQDPEGRQEPTAPFPRQGTYAGKLVCRDCHEDQWDAITAGVHAPVIASDVLHGCETCHGPGDAHANDIDNDTRLITFPEKLSPAAQIAVCGQCHRDQIASHGGDPKGFLLAGKGCTACHTVHQPIPEKAHPDLDFHARLDVAQVAEPVGSARCIQCHPLRDGLLEHSAHRSLAAEHSDTGCETCHGPGSLHVESGGVGRLITRPDRAADTITTCRQCHEDVDPVDFHWHDRRKPPLTSGITCTTCHRVHRPQPPPVPAKRDAPVDPDSGETVAAAPAPTNALCVTCHAPVYEVLKGTIHERLTAVDLPLSLGCGGCHEGAEQHALSGGRKALVDSLRGSSARHQLETCMSCHDGNAHVAQARAGSHFRNGVGCLSCHAPAAPADEFRAAAEKRCSGCHAGVAAEFAFPNHHPVPEGEMGCSDCHEPHSARPKVRDLQRNELACLRCHAQYRGPFVFEHQASRIDGCMACHRPHGSSNRRMLRLHRSQQLCLQCHGDFPAFHDQTPGAVFTNCLNCHTEIHGSQLSRYFFR